MKKRCLECGVEQTKENVNVGKGWLGIEHEMRDIGSICGGCWNEWDKLNDQELESNVYRVIAKVLSEASIHDLPKLWKEIEK